MVGQGVVTLTDHDEDYVITFPKAYGRYSLSILQNLFKSDARSNYMNARIRRCAAAPFLNFHFLAEICQKK